MSSGISREFGLCVFNCKLKEILEKIRIWGEDLRIDVEDHEAFKLKSINSGNAHLIIQLLDELCPANSFLHTESELKIISMKNELKQYIDATNNS